MPPLSKKKDAEPPPPIVADPDTKLSEQPRYVEAMARHNALSNAHQKVTARMREIDLIVGAGIPPAETADNHVKAALEFAESGTVQRPLYDINGLHEERRVLSAQAGALDRELRAQFDVMYLLERELSQAYFRANKAEHDKLMQRHVAALRALGAIEAEEDAYLSRMHKLGYDVSLQDRVDWPLIGQLRDRQSAIAARLCELHKFNNV